MAGSISSAGIGSGLDVSNIITKLMAVEQLPLTKLQNKATGMQTQLSAFGQMQSLVSSFQDATAPLFKADNYSLTSATSNVMSSARLAFSRMLDGSASDVIVRAAVCGPKPPRPACGWN